MRKCGYITIIGRPNVGKSTLLNRLLGEKISITSSKPQTTRSQILGIKTEYNTQFIYIDTPGIHQAGNNAMNRYMNRTAESAILEAHVIVWVIDVMHFTQEDENILMILKKNSEVPVILALNKVDKLKEKARLLPLIDELKEKYPFAYLIPISALKSDNLAVLENKLAEFLGESDFYFEENQLTDKNNYFLAAEMIREKLIQTTQEELPYTTAVVVDKMEKKEKIIEIHATIWVAREGQKAIVIGKNGEKLKKIGMLARSDIEHFLKSKVFLQLWVKVKKQWTDDESTLQSLGFK